MPDVWPVNRFPRLWRCWVDVSVISRVSVLRELGVGNAVDWPTRAAIRVRKRAQDPYTGAFVEVESHDLFWEYI